MNLIQILKRPFYSDTSPMYWVKMAVLFGLFVFLFLYLFRPFQIEGVEGDLLMVCLTFGGITTGAMLVLDLIFLPLLVKKVCEENWNVGLSILWTVIHIGVIALLNSLYFSYTFLDGFEWRNLIWFFATTMMVSVFPVGFVFILQERRDNSKYQKESRVIMDHIKEIQLVPKEQMILIKSKNANEDVELSVDHLLYLQSADNYVTVFYLDGNDQIQKKIIRNSLSSIAIDLSDQDQLFHCHRSYLVNLSKVDNVSGNAQGFRLHIQGASQEIPVSRKYNDFVKSYFSKN
ncbi:LytTR family transcriptional regulator [Paracrocinitomix mangrovi]|uniref:LytR/AlgR family response regulator transcription factor n=1 Tax=Paracrocinitomix mangrovi TaxID=2862509 RepID=UPI001C8E0009|nr:LytTR family DNA-binding domain-containing protein [Paracrocinitomix mangrovi]UKN01058.1 LytTR family transcriptional regulator [Paracrocinitomix mangrovi]